MRFLKSILLLLLISTLYACGGGSGGDSNESSEPEDTVEPNYTSLTSANGGVITLSSRVAPNALVTVTFPDGSIETVTADENGDFTVSSKHSQPVGKTSFSSSSSDGSSVTSVIPPTAAPKTTSVTANANGSIVVSGTATAGSTVIAVFPDGSTKESIVSSDGTFKITSAASQAMGEIILSSVDEGVASKPTFISATNTEIALYKATGVIPKLSFEPSLGINTEAPQGGVDTAGMPMPFVDIFRTARPFEEFEYNIDSNGNKTAVTGDITVDNNGWPIKLDADKKFTKTVLLQGALQHSIPDGVYSLLYSGDAKFEFSTTAGALKSFKKVTNENKFELHIALDDVYPRRSNETERQYEARVTSTNQFGFNLKSVDAGVDLNIKDIRIVMSGGTCTGNPFLRVYSAADCPSGTTYESFESRLKADRNAIIFNPDYLAFLRNFKVIRMMNLMESSLKKLCFSPTDCPAEVGTWDHRAKLDDAVWGGNDGRTPDEDHKGVPIEVMVALANTLQRDIWVNMPHVATNDYIKNYAKYVHDNLAQNLKVYVEYSNEVWNPGFAAHNYAIAKGKELNLDTVPAEYANSVNRDADYFARLNYYSKRAEDIFILWKSEFNSAGDTRLVRVLGSFIGDTILTKEMLKNVVISNVDAVAIAPYFFGCPYEAQCIDAPKNLLTAKTVDDIFDIIDQPANQDVKSLEGTIAAVKKQLIETNAQNVKLVSYEGGQHLVTGVFGSVIEDDDKPRLRKLFNDANRDPRMKQRYLTFLNAWRDLADDGATLFTLYTLPQSFYRFGNFGIKEHLNSPRNESPKFDGVMKFQETAEACWWDRCDP